MKRVPLDSRRKVAVALFSGPSEGNIHARVEVVVDGALEWLERESERAGCRLTLTHLVGSALGAVMVRVPELNCTLVGSALYTHEQADIAFLVAVSGGEDVDWVKIDAVDRKSTVELARELGERAGHLRDRETAQRGGGLLSLLPVEALRPLMGLAGWFAAHGGSLAWLGIEARPFGSAVVTNAATYGIEEVFVSRTGFAHVPLNLAICSATERPVVVDGQVVVRRVASLCLNADHRYVDGLQIGAALQLLRELVEHPERLTAESGTPE